MSALPKTSHSVIYRATQFFAALRAMLLPGSSLTPADQALITSILPLPAQQHLFARMSPNDQRHALAVVRTLHQAGYTHLALLQAALLHDVAKSLGQPILHRVLIVLLKAFWPALLERISEWRMANGEWGDNFQNSLIRPFAHLPISAWRKPFVIHAHHPAIGATWAAQAACEPLAVKLIARHQEALKSEAAGEEETLLAALQWADNMN